MSPAKKPSTRAKKTTARKTTAKGAPRRAGKKVRVAIIGVGTLREVRSCRCVPYYPHHAPKPFAVSGVHALYHSSSTSVASPPRHRLFAPLRVDRTSQGPVRHPYTSRQHRSLRRRAKDWREGSQHDPRRQSASTSQRSSKRRLARPTTSWHLEDRKVDVVISYLTRRREDATLWYVRAGTSGGCGLRELHSCIHRPRAALAEALRGASAPDRGRPTSSRRSARPSRTVSYAPVHGSWRAPRSHVPAELRWPRLPEHA